MESIKKKAKYYSNKEGGYIKVLSSSRNYTKIMYVGVAGKEYRQPFKIQTVPNTSLALHQLKEIKEREFAFAVRKFR